MKARTGCLIVLLTLVLTWGVEVVCGVVLIWSRLNCWRTDIDINTGRVRTSEYWAELLVCESERRDGEFVRVISAGKEPEPPEWHTSYVSSLLVPRPPYYAYQDAHQQPTSLESLWKCGNFTRAAKEQTAKNVLLLWHRDKGSYSAHVYLSELESLCNRRRAENNDSMDTKDLPPLSAAMECP
jgi:hypothetical protein